jgi:DNA-binding GntR family transcriptional regulator
MRRDLDSLTQGPTLIEQTYASILNAICEGRLQPGERLNQDELANRLQVSRQPVGQALSILKAQGFVRDAQRRGLIVAPIEPAFFRAIYELRQAIDPMAAKLAAERGSDEELVEGRELIAAGRSAVEAGAIDGLIAADMEFHMWMYRLARNSLLVDTMQLYWNHLRRAMGEVLRAPEGRLQIWNEHQAIYEAIAARDGSAAGRHSLRHLSGASQRILDSWG